MLVLATVQSHVARGVQENGDHIRHQMALAAQAGARIVHFPEGALSGYVKEQIGDWSEVDWPALRDELRRVAALAGRLGVWVVVGANHPMPRHRTLGERWPQNCLIVISDQGAITGRYSKRLLSNTELTYWYTPGSVPLVFEVDGIRFGCALCIEVVFPHLFTEYERLGATCVLLSSFSADPIHSVMAQAHAATNGFWLSLSTPVACSQTLPTTLFAPDGRSIGTCPPGVSGMVLHTINPDTDLYRVATQIARPWRARARSGELYLPHVSGRRAVPSRSALK